ncbi:MAG: hypothetical protein VB934_17095, partial [Polyangiaceae bacterium]
MQLWIDLLLARGKVLAVLMVALTAVIATEIPNLLTDNSDTALLSEDDPHRAEVDQVLEDFPRSTSVLFAFLPKDGDVFSLDSLHAMEDLTDRYSEVESAVSVASLLNQRLDAV